MDKNGVLSFVRAFAFHLEFSLFSHCEESPIIAFARKHGGRRRNPKMFSPAARGRGLSFHLPPKPVLSKLVPSVVERVEGSICRNLLPGLFTFRLAASLSPRFARGARQQGCPPPSFRAQFTLSQACPERSRTGRRAEVEDAPSFGVSKIRQGGNLLRKPRRPASRPYLLAHSIAVGQISPPPCPPSFRAVPHYCFRKEARGTTHQFPN